MWEKLIKIRLTILCLMLFLTVPAFSQQPVKQQLELRPEQAKEQEQKQAKQEEGKPLEWMPPRARARGKGPFAPRPWQGHNIFKGEAAKWLADAIERFNAENNVELDNPAIAGYVSQLGHYLAAYSLAPEDSYRFIVTENEEPNATSIGDGRVFVSL